MPLRTTVRISKLGWRARRQSERSEVERGGSASLLVEGVLNPNNGAARLSGEALRKDLKQRTRELLIYSGLRPDQQAWMESPTAVRAEARLSSPDGSPSGSEVERGGSEERLNTEDKRAIDLLRTSSGSASLDGGGAEPH
jgi:hypothetical protein